ncbi:BACON domain-containing protein [Methanosarcina sp. Mfa9]|uniref:BACON domain-containing protein n=1 Tax=Methanosarcina sp. Mfa9 TaxID=3439063 RepID=UPI003F85593A
MTTGQPGSEQFQILNEGGGNLEWEVSSDQWWITLNPESGTNSGTVTCTVDTSEMDLGEYRGVITINSNVGIKNGKATVVIEEGIH